MVYIVCATIVLVFLVQETKRGINELKVKLQFGVLILSGRLSPFKIIRNCLIQC